MIKSYSSIEKINHRGCFKIVIKLSKSNKSFQTLSHRKTYENFSKEKKNSQNF